MNVWLAPPSPPNATRRDEYNNLTSNILSAKQNQNNSPCMGGQTERREQRTQSDGKRQSDE